jgi:hypothetical protein
MHRIDHPTATNDNKFTSGNPQTAVKPTVVTADWANATQEEIAHFIESRGITLNKADNTQLKQAVDNAVKVSDENVIIQNNQTDTSLGEKFSFDISTVKSGVIEFTSYRKDATKEHSISGLLHVMGIMGTQTFEIIPEIEGEIDDIGLTFNIVNASGIGSINYSTTDYAGANYSGKMTFKIKKFKL